MKHGTVTHISAQGTETDVLQPSISAIFYFNFSYQVPTPDIYGAQWYRVTVLEQDLQLIFIYRKSESEAKNGGNLHPVSDLQRFFCAVSHFK